MTDKCPSRGAEGDETSNTAEEAMRAVMKLARTMAVTRQDDGQNPNDFCDAILAGLMQGVVLAACHVTPLPYREAVTHYLREELEESISTAERLSAEAGTVQ